MPVHIVDKNADQSTSGEEEQIFAEFLRQRGLKFTRARRQLLRKIFGMHDHFTAEQLMERLKKERVRASKATVYRTLSILLECDLLTCHDFGEGSLYYEHTFGHDHHDHLFCLNCKSIVEFRDDRIEDLQARVAHEAGFTMIAHSLKMYGLCKPCSAKPDILARHSQPSASLHHRS